MRTAFFVAPFLLLLLTGLRAEEQWTDFFREDGPPRGWLVRHWANVKDESPDKAQWQVKDGVLHGSDPRGTWLISEQEYADFVLQFEWQLGDRGNSGCGLRFPLVGDPAFDGLELQMVDPRYYGDYAAAADELSGSLYKAVPPRVQKYKPEAWNRYEITCKGSRVTILLNGETIQDVDLDEQTRPLERGAPLKERPRKGHIGFQELSRGGGHVMIRHARIRLLD